MHSEDDDQKNGDRTNQESMGLHKSTWLIDRVDLVTGRTLTQDLGKSLAYLELITARKMKPQNPPNGCACSSFSCAVMLFPTLLGPPKSPSLDEIDVFP